MADHQRDAPVSPLRPGRGRGGAAGFGGRRKDSAADEGAGLGNEPTAGGGVMPGKPFAAHFALAVLDSHDALRLQLTKPLPHGQANPPGNAQRRDPWVIVTTSGAYCYRVTGATDVRAGRPLTYTCAGASALAGRPNRTRPVWTVSLLPAGASKHYVTTAVRSAWW